MRSVRLVGQHSRILFFSLLKHAVDQFKALFLTIHSRKGIIQG